MADGEMSSISGINGLIRKSLTEVPVSGIIKARDFSGRYSSQLLGKEWLHPAARIRQTETFRRRYAALIGRKRNDSEIICLLRRSYNHSLTALLPLCFRDNPVVR